jgi:hypothetical protein
MLPGRLPQRAAGEAWAALSVVRATVRRFHAVHATTTLRQLRCILQPSRQESNATSRSSLRRLPAAMLERQVRLERRQAGSARPPPLLAWVLIPPLPERCLLTVEVQQPDCWRLSRVWRWPLAARGWEWWEEPQALAKRWPLAQVSGSPPGWTLPPESREQQAARRWVRAVVRGAQPHHPPPAPAHRAYSMALAAI